MQNNITLHHVKFSTLKPIYLVIYLLTRLTAHEIALIKYTCYLKYLLTNASELSRYFR